MKKTALLIDGGWFNKGLGKILKLPGGWPSATQVIQNAKLALQHDEELYRIFYYDCEPYTGRFTNPVDFTDTDYSNTPASMARKYFFQELGQTDYVALRRGALKVRGWNFNQDYTQHLMSSRTLVPPQPGDIAPNFEQKGVDMRIGLDVATLAFKKVVDRVILISGDTDMIPALKLARREGLQVWVVRLGTWPLDDRLIEDSDGVRTIQPVL